MGNYVLRLLLLLVVVLINFQVFGVATFGKKSLWFVVSSHGPALSFLLYPLSHGPVWGFVFLRGKEERVPEFLEHVVMPEDTLTGICIRYKVLVLVQVSVQNLSVNPRHDGNPGDGGPLSNST